MDLTRTSFGTWNGGRYMHFGEQLSEEQFVALIQQAYQEGIRTFVTADTYGAGRADSQLGEALKDVSRDSYCLVGMVGHDFYGGLRTGAKGYPRFTEPGLRPPEEYAGYLKMACEKSLERCRSGKFDLLMLHNPDQIGYTSDVVWDGLRALKQAGLADRLGIAPGPANGFTLDVIDCFERHGADIDWAMLILNPFEPWPGLLALPAAEKHDVKVITRVVDYGGLFHDDVKKGHVFRDGDHRAFRPAGWVEHGNDKLEKIRPIAERHGLSMLQLSCLWDLAHEPVKSVVPTLIQEAHAEAKSISDKLKELARLPEVNPLTAEEVTQMETIGDNTGCMKLKGGSERHAGQDPRPDEWPLADGMLTVAQRWNLGSAWSY